VVEALRSAATCSTAPRCKELLCCTWVAFHLGLHTGEGVPEVELAVSPLDGDLYCPSSAEVDRFVRAQIHRRLRTPVGSGVVGVDWGVAKFSDVVKVAHVDQALKVELGGVIRDSQDLCQRPKVVLGDAAQVSTGGEGEVVRCNVGRHAIGGRADNVRLVDGMVERA
jgi:hypothetical protein